MRLPASPRLVFRLGLCNGELIPAPQFRTNKSPELRGVVGMPHQLIVCLPFTLGLAIVYTIEHGHILGAGNAPLVEGQIVQREQTRRWGGIPAGKVTVRLLDEDVVVSAITLRSDMQKLPERVCFRYTGDPNREVFIEGEENPLWVTLLCWAMSVGIFVFCVLPRLRNRKPASVTSAGRGAWVPNEADKQIRWEQG